jgi:hypothetical protein
MPIFAVFQAFQAQCSTHPLLDPWGLLEVQFFPGWGQPSTAQHTMDALPGAMDAALAVQDQSVEVTT